MGWEKQESKIYHPKFILEGFETETLKGKGKRVYEIREPKIYYPKFIFASAVPGQVRKTIDRMYSRAMKMLKFSTDAGK